MVLAAGAGGWLPREDKKGIVSHPFPDDPRRTKAFGSAWPTLAAPAPWEIEHLAGFRAEGLEFRV